MAMFQFFKSQQYYQNKEIEAASKNLSVTFGNLQSDPSKQGSFLSE